jgi:hypothetical protein
VYKYVLNCFDQSISDEKLARMHVLSHFDYQTDRTRTREIEYPCPDPECQSKQRGVFQTHKAALQHLHRHHVNFFAQKRIPVPQPDESTGSTSNVLVNPVIDHY